MCLYPKLVNNPKYKANKKNGGNIPPLKDPRVAKVPIACGKCIECMKAKAREWSIRMNEEIREHKNGKFTTLTFDEENLEILREIAFKERIEETEFDGKNFIKWSKEQQRRNRKILDNEVASLAVRRFTERWRKQDKNKKTIRHWLVTELGHVNTERIHLHGILFTDKTKDEIEKIWSYGRINIGTWVNEQSINYIVKYISKQDLDHKGYKPIILASKGLGKGYLNRTDAKDNKYKKDGTKEEYIFRNGKKASLPILYRNHIYTDEEKELLWIEKLNKKERYVLGQKIDISESEEEYHKALKYAQKFNKKMGYGDDSKEWSIENYKKQREDLLNK